MNPHCFIRKVVIKATGDVFQREPAIPGRWYKTIKPPYGPRKIEHVLGPMLRPTRGQT